MASIGARLSACALGFATGSVASWKLLNDEIKRTTAVQVAALSGACVHEFAGSKRPFHQPTQRRLSTEIDLRNQHSSFL